MVPGLSTLGRGCTGPLPGVDGACTLARVMWTPLQVEGPADTESLSM